MQRTYGLNHHAILTLIVQVIDIPFTSQSNRRSRQTSGREIMLSQLQKRIKISALSHRQQSRMVACGTGFGLRPCRTATIRRPYARLPRTFPAVRRSIPSLSSLRYAFLKRLTPNKNPPSAVVLSDRAYSARSPKVFVHNSCPEASVLIRIRSVCSLETVVVPASAYPPSAV